MKLLLNPDLALITGEELEFAYAQGLLRKSELTHGKYYRGACRNADYARWHASGQRFVYARRKYGHRYLEAIAHPVDEQRYDVFVVVEEATPQPEYRIDDVEFEAFFSP